MNPSTEITTALTAIKERAEKATPGPWARTVGNGVWVDHFVDDRWLGFVSLRHPITEQRKADAAFIVASRSDIVRLVKALESVTKRIKESQENDFALFDEDEALAELAKILTSDTP